MLKFLNLGIGETSPPESAPVAEKSETESSDSSFLSDIDDLDDIEDEEIDITESTGLGNHQVNQGLEEVSSHMLK